MDVLRVVVDTNVLVSALISPDEAAARRLAHPVPYTLVTRAEILDALARVLTYPRLTRRYRLTPARSQMYWASLATGAVLIAVDADQRAATRAAAPDPDDDKFLACALAAQADVAVSRDIHLRGLATYADMPVRTPATRWACLDQLAVG